MVLELIIVFLLSQLALGVYLWYQVKDLYQFPNLFGTPVIGNLYYFYKGLLFKSLHSLYQYTFDIDDKVGDGIYFTFIKGRRAAILSCPHIIEEISYNPNASDKAPDIYATVNPLVKGIFGYCPCDSEFKLRRKEVNNSLTKSTIEGTYYPIFTKAANRLVEAFKENKDNVDLTYYCTFTSVNIVKGTHCGVEQFMPENERFYKAWSWLTKFITVIFSNRLVEILFVFTFKILEKIIMKKVDFLRNQVGGTVAQQMKKIKQDPTATEERLPLSVVITLRIKNRKLGQFDLNKELYELLMAGSHTVTSAMIGSFAYLAALPEIQEKVWNEQYEIFGNSKRDANLDDLKKMSYLDKFLKETLRFMSPGMIAKVTTGEVKAGGVTIPAGTTLYFLLLKIRMNPKFWGKDPQIFDPEKDFDDKPKYANSAFGIGVRSCPGMTYARIEIKTVISAIVRNFKLSTRQKFEDFRYESHLLPEIVNLKPIQVEPRLP